MHKFLSIVIPRYQETEREIFPLLSSINNQLGIDFDNIEVFIVTDGGGKEPLDENFLALFDFDIKQLRLERNGGCGVARQAAIDIANGDYILCCDADDVLHNVGALGAFIQEANSSSSDIIISDFLEEQVGPDGKYYYKVQKPVGCWMHGKLLRRQFLLQNNIRFHDDLKVHEDSYFLCIAMSLTDKVRYLPVTTYVWKYHPDSTTRENNGIYLYDSFPTYIKAMTMAWSVVAQLHPEQMWDKVLQFVHYNYFMFHRPDWLHQEYQSFLIKAERTFAEQILPWIHYYYEVHPTIVAKNYNTEREKHFNGCIEGETITAWLQRLGLK